MTVQLKYHQKDTAVLRYSFFDSDSDKEQDILFLAKCGIFRLMVDDHPSLSELYKIRYNEHGGLQLNDYQKILKKRLSSLIKDVKEQEDLQLHILIPQYQGNYFSFCVMISSLKPFTRSTMENNDTSRLFSSYDNFVIHQPDAISLHLDQMNSTELQKLFRIAYSENNNGDYEFSLSLDANGIPAFLYDEYRVELGIHEIAILQNIVNNHVTYYDMPLIQLNDRYARSIGWDMNDRIVSITEPRKIATFGNERIMVQALHILQSFYLRHQIRSIELINPKDGHRSLKEELFLVTDHNYLIITTKAKQWKKAIQNLSLQSDGKYSHDTPHYYHHIDQLGIDLIQLFHSDRNILIKLIRSWANITSSEKSAEYAYQSLLDLFDDAFKIYGLEQLSEFQLRMFLKDSTFDDLSSPELHNTLVSKYAAIFSHSFFNFKEKFDIGTNNKNRRLWKTDFLSKGIHIIDISGTTQIEQLALQSFFLILQEVRYLKNTWTFHSFDEGIRHSFEKVDQIVKEIAVNKSVLHFTHTTEMSSFLRNNDLLLFDREFDTFSVLRTFGVNSLFEKGGDTNLLVHEQTNTTLLKPIEPQNLDILYDHNVLVKLSPKDIIYPHDIAPAKQVETQASTSTAQETILDHDIEDVGLGDEDAIFSQPFAEEEDNINEEYEEDNYIGPDLLFKIPVLASFRNYRQYYFQEIEFASNLPKDIVEKQLQQLISLKWIETTIKEKRDVYYPLDKGKGYIDNLMGQIPELKSVEAEIFDLVYRDLETSDDEKIIDKNNILDVLLALRLSYHNLTEYDDRKGILIKLCSLCKYISDSFAEYNDELESYYYWSLGVLAAFHGAQLASKRDEHLLIRKITEITKAISDLLTDKLQHDFTMRQVETSSDEIYVFNETMKEDEKEAQDITKEKVEAHSINRVVEKEVVSESVSKAKSPPSVMNIPKASSDAPVLERQLRPDELKPISMSPKIGSWYKFYRKNYDQQIFIDPLILDADDIIFAFMVNSILNNSSGSFGIKKHIHSLMFLNEQQMEDTVNRSPLPLNVNYNNLINSGILETVDVGYNVVDIRTTLPVPNVSVDPMYKRMNLNEVLSMIEENPLNFIQSRTIQSYIYADYYDIELQPVVAICYAILIDKREMKEKIADFEKFIPWIFTMIKLFMMKQRDFMRSNELEYLNDSFTTELKRIHVTSSLELLEYVGDNDTAIKLQFLVGRKLKKLGLKISDIDKHSNNDGVAIKAGTQASGESMDRFVTKPDKKKRERIIFSPSLLDQLEQDGLDEISDQVKPLGKRTTKEVIKKTSIQKKTRKRTKKSTTKSSKDMLPTTMDENISFSKNIITSIENICDEACENADTTSPTDLIISIFYNIIYPNIIGNKSTINDLRLIELFNEVGELSGVSNSVDFSRNLGDMQERWEKYGDTRDRIIKSFVRRIKETSRNFVYNSLFRDLLISKSKRASL